MSAYGIKSIQNKKLLNRFHQSSQKKSSTNNDHRTFQSSSSKNLLNHIALLEHTLEQRQSMLESSNEHIKKLLANEVFLNHQIKCLRKQNKELLAEHTQNDKFQGKMRYKPLHCSRSSMDDHLLDSTRPIRISSQENPQFELHLEAIEKGDRKCQNIKIEEDQSAKLSFHREFDIKCEQPQQKSVRKLEQAIFYLNNKFNQLKKEAAELKQENQYYKLTNLTQQHMIKDLQSRSEQIQSKYDQELSATMIVIENLNNQLIALSQQVKSQENRKEQMTINEIVKMQEQQEYYSYQESYEEQKQQGKDVIQQNQQDLNRINQIIKSRKMVGVKQILD